MMGVGTVLPFAFRPHRGGDGFFMPFGLHAWENAPDGPEASILGLR